MKRIDIAILLGIIGAILLSSFTAFAGQCQDVREEVVRIHVLANSDSKEDQELKLAVRDAVLVGTEEIFTLSGTKQQVEVLALNNLEGIRQLALEEIHRQGYDYSVDVRMVNMFFDTRTYGEVTLPAGYYDAVRVIIGEGKGANWWCVMFPPMCIPAATPNDGQELSQQITQLGQTPQYKAKFAVVELVEGIKDKLDAKQETQLSKETFLVAQRAFQ